MPRGSRSNSETPRETSSSLRSLEAAGCDTFEDLGRSVNVACVANRDQ